MISLLHFGHYKAAAQDDDHSEAHAIIFDMVTRMGISLPRWQYGLTVVLEKKPGCLLIEKIRAMLIMEADFNMVNKLIVGVRMMQLAKDTQEMPAEQSGRRKHHSAGEAALNRCLYFDILWQSRTNGILNLADTLTCYDCMHHTGVSLACRQ